MYLLPTLDPLAALSLHKGVRMCPDCPHCTSSDMPCSDAFGSNAELMGGVGGRTDGVCGAVECQKSSGSLHFHFWAFIQRAHQMHTLEEIANMLESALLNAEDLKRFCAHMCCESYPDEKAYAGAQKDLEKRWPQFNEKDDAIDGVVPEWGMYRCGRVAPFVWSDTGLTYGDFHEEQVMGVEGSAVSDATEKRRELGCSCIHAALQQSPAGKPNVRAASHPQEEQDHR